MAQESILELSLKIQDFIRKTLLGQESAIYKLSSNENFNIFSEGMNVLKNKLNDDQIKIIFYSFIENYLNQCYRSLILKDDQYVCSSFGSMKKCCNHSEVCLLNIIAFYLSEVMQKMDRKLLDISSYDSYMSSADQIISKMLKELNLETKLNHICTGIDISKCDPNKPMFYKKVYSVYKKN